MKAIGISALLLTILLIVFFIYYFTTKTIQVTPAEFEVEFKNSKVAHTLYAYKLQGLEGGNIYLSKKELTPFLKKWKEIILYTEFTQLSLGVKKMIHEELNTNE